MKNMVFPRFLKISIALVLCLNIVIFAFLGISIQKMSRIEENSSYNARDIELIREKRIVFIIDEAHRDVFGEMLRTIKATFPNAMFFGFTGTPIHDENQKKMTMPRTANRAYMRWRISFAMACFSSGLYCTLCTFSRAAGEGRAFLVAMKMTSERIMAATDAMNE